MPRRSWYSLVGSAGLVMALAVTLAAGSAAQAVGPPITDAAALQLADLPRCGPAVGPDVGPEASWTAVPDLDKPGTLVGWTLGVDPTGAPPLRIQLPPESSMSDAGGGRAVVTADDGLRSTVAVISAIGRCVTTVASLDAVARSAIVRTRDGLVLFHAVERANRRDLGVWLVAAPGKAPVLLARPLAADDRAVRTVGRVFATALRLDRDGDRVAVQSCGERSCRTRVLDLGSGREWRVDHPHQGPLVGFDRDRTTFREPCPDAPCPLRTIVFDPTVNLPETESSR